VQKVTHTIGIVFGRMFRALIAWGLIIGGVATAWFSYSSHHLPRNGEWGLIITIAIVAGLLGMMSTLVWELSHLGTISRAIRHHGEHQTTSP
jgi:hypothetical protein